MKGSHLHCSKLNRIFSQLLYKAQEKVISLAFQLVYSKSCLHLPSNHCVDYGFGHTPALHASLLGDCVFF